MTSNLHKFKLIYRYIYKSTCDLTHLKNKEENSFNNIFDKQENDFRN